MNFMTTKTMKPRSDKLRVILSGGGTAGHIYPALSVADVLREEGVEVLFVGALGRMEMERVPASGYEIVGVPISGLQRRLTLRNLAVPFKMIKCTRISARIIRDFGPDAVAGFGGYASAPIVKAAQKAGIPTLLQEQNSYAGLTNRMLARRADTICVAYEGMEKYFPAGKILLTGNPLRGSFGDLKGKKEEAYASFGLDPRRKTILVTGGSLGTRTLNDMMLGSLEALGGLDHVQVIWQTGRYYAESVGRAVEGRQPANVWRGEFIDRMDHAYAVADVVIGRAGASTVSELGLLGKPAVFVPSPNVAEDHQTRNAATLVGIGAAVMVPDDRAVEKALPAALELLADEAGRMEMAEKIRATGRPRASRDVAGEIMKLAGRKI